ncbi:MAG: 16S rRNA (cytosine(967)-C(5))-methyltransferase RsmB [Bacillota bacterium]|nr:16S rRNA (cytosine(967)-C(5))-methyltransferase RsmB [Bacillota bacterium]
MKIDPVRETALKIIYEINENNAYSNLALNKGLNNWDLKDIDKAFITEMVYGVTKWKLALDWTIQQFSNIRLKKMSPWVLNILRLGTYQILYMSKVPDSAACNESVNLSRKYGHQAASRFINAVLRNISRNRDNIKYPDEEKELKQYLSVKYSHPEWLVEHWLEKFGREFTESFLESNNGIPDLTARVNTLRTTKKELLELLKKDGIEAEPGRYLEDAIIFKGQVSVARLETFKNGFFQVQDESSMLVGKLLAPKPGQLVMDVCSAPGGKATHLAQLMNNSGTVIARDIHEHKIKLIEDAAKRLGIGIIRTELYDALKFDDNFRMKADRVLVDAPCSGFGIIRRKPDIKWAKDIEDKREILKLQRNILAVAAEYVKPGGILIYSTCTIEDDENYGMVKEFLDSTREFVPLDISDDLPDGLPKTNAKDGFIQLYPNVEGIDGFFIAKMIRKE